MDRIILGKKDNNLEYAFRETCFGICEHDNKILVAIDSRINKYTLIGGSIDDGETKEETLIREFDEECSIKIKNIKPFITIDCFWFAEGKYPMNSLANFFFVDIDSIEENNHEFSFEFIDPKLIEFPLPYQQKVLELYLEKKKHL